MTASAAESEIRVYFHKVAIRVTEEKRSVPPGLVGRRRKKGDSSRSQFCGTDVYRLIGHAECKLH
jgi:hypothetical protein